jgi:hypothetical protein
LFFGLVDDLTDRLRAPNGAVKICTFSHNISDHGTSRERQGALRGCPQPMLSLGRIEPVSVDGSMDGLTVLQRFPLIRQIAEACRNYWQCCS